MAPAEAADQPEDIIDAIRANDALNDAVNKGQLDEQTFEQILDMDDGDPSREFSRELVFDFFQQAVNTITQMRKALKDKDLAKLSADGHFLKGSSATIGLTKVKDNCEKIQHLGAKMDETGSKDVNPDKALAALPAIIKTTARETRKMKIALEKFYHGQSTTPDESDEE